MSQRILNQFKKHPNKPKPKKTQPKPNQPKPQNGHCFTG